MHRLIFIGIVLLLAGCGGGENRRIEAVVAEAAGLLRSRPDSALRLIESIDPGRISRRRTRAGYALVYSAALDKNYVDVDRDTLIATADRYYATRPCSDSLRAEIDYYRGRVYQNAGEFAQAIPCYLTARERAERTDYGYLAALVCCRLGEIHSAQMNFRRMLDSYREAYALWDELGRVQNRNGALLNMANAWSSLGDNEQVERLYAEALDVALALDDVDTASACLGNLASIYLRRDDFERAGRAIRRMEQLAPDNLTHLEYLLLCESSYRQGQIDRARYYLGRAAAFHADPRDEAMAAYHAFRLEMAAGNEAEAAEWVDRYMALSDSISREAVAQSAAVAEGKFYREQSAFAAYRLKVRSGVELLIGVLVVVAAAFLIHLYRQRMRRKQAQLERYLAALDQLRDSKQRIAARLASAQHVENRLRESISAQMERLDRFGRIFYEKPTTKAQQESIYRQVKQFFDNLSRDTATRRELERTVNALNEDILVKLREQIPQFKPADIDLLCYIYAGFSAQIISVIVRDSVSNIYTRKSRLKTRIAKSEVPDRELFLAHMS